MDIKTFNKSLQSKSVQTPLFTAITSLTKTKKSSVYKFKKAYAGGWNGW